MLSSLKVLDLSRILAGPYCTMLLADLGANVYKIERPDGGDETRSWGPPFHHGESCYFLSVNRNKKSVAIDFRRPEGSEIIKKLATKCDVLVENFHPGYLKNLGLDYMSMKLVNPSLVYCSLTGYGQKGPLAHRHAYDVVVASVCGLTGITGPKDGEPSRVGIAFTEISTGLYAYGSILAALLSRMNTNVGTHIDANLFSTQMAFLSHVAAEWLNLGIDGARWGTAHPSIVPYQSFSTSDDRYIVIGAGNDNMFKLLCKVLNLTDLPSDEKFSTNSERVKNREELCSVLQSRFAEHTSDYWESVFRNVHLPFGRVNSISEGMAVAFEHNPNSFLEMENEQKHRLRVTGPAVKFSRGSFLRDSHEFPPKLGENTFSILVKELSFSKEKLAQLQSDGIILQYKL